MGSTWGWWWLTIFGTWGPYMGWQVRGEVTQPNMWSLCKNRMYNPTQATKTGMNILLNGKAPKRLERSVVLHRNCRGRLQPKPMFWMEPVWFQLFFFNFSSDRRNGRWEEWQRRVWHICSHLKRQWMNEWENEWKLSKYDFLPGVCNNNWHWVYCGLFLGLIDKLLNWSPWIHLLWPQKGVTWGNRLSIERPGWGKRPRAAPGDIWVMKRDALKGAIWKSGPWPPGLMAALFWL